jgi:hypothetical protein
MPRRKLLQPQLAERDDVTRGRLWRLAATTNPLGHSPG